MAGYREPSYKLTAAGGIPLCRPTTMEKVVLEIAGQHDGLRYVRRMARPQYVMTVDIARKTWHASDSGTVLDEQGIRDHGPWVHELWKLLCIAIPSLNPTPKEETPNDQATNPDPGT